MIDSQLELIVRLFWFVEKFAIFFSPGYQVEFGDSCSQESWFYYDLIRKLVTVDLSYFVEDIGFDLLDKNFKVVLLPSSLPIKLVLADHLEVFSTLGRDIKVYTILKSLWAEFVLFTNVGYIWHAEHEVFLAARLANEWIPGRKLFSNHNIPFGKIHNDAFATQYYLLAEDITLFQHLYRSYVDTKDRKQTLHLAFVLIVNHDSWLRLSNAAYSDGCCEVKHGIGATDPNLIADFFTNHYDLFVNIISILTLSS